MAEPALTKKIIADGFKAIMAKKSFDKITIADITAHCGLNRQTFYYHFQDKYELLNWILTTEVITPFTDDLTIDNWNEKLLGILIVVKENSRFYSNAFNTSHGDEFRRYLFRIVTNVLSGVIDQITDGQKIKPEDRQFIAEFFAYGVAGSVTNWVRTGMKRSPEDTVLYIQGIVNGFKSFAAVRDRSGLFRSGE